MTLDKLSFQAVQRLTLRRDFLRDFELKIEKNIETAFINNALIKIQDLTSVLEIIYRP